MTDSSSAAVRPRNGPPEAVRTSESTVAGSRFSRHWSAAECSLSTGRSRPPPRIQAATREIAGRDEALLVGEREVDPVLERPERRGQAGEADDRVQHDVGLRRLEQLRQVAAGLDVRRDVRRRGVVPDAAAHSSSSGCASITSSACRPIDPVAPSSAIFLIEPV